MYRVIFIFLSTFINGCSIDMLSTGGIISTEEHKLIFISFCLMLVIVLPVIFMTIYFIFKFRDTKNSIYLPNWCKSNLIEIVVWIIPIILISILGVITWNTTHKFDPSRCIVDKKEPLEIQVVSLDWKWLFIYPKYSVGIINKVIIPLNTVVIFKITSNSVMNSFFIPRLGGQIYAMPGMITKLHLIANKIGIYHGISSNYSGIGFSDMKFITVVKPSYKSFLNCINIIKESKYKINTMFDFERLAIPTINNLIEYYSYIGKDLFDKVINKFNDYRKLNVK